MSSKVSDAEFMQLEQIDVNSSLEEFANIYQPSDFREAVTQLRNDGVNKDAHFPFWDRFGDKFVLRPREVTILFGSRGSFKSTLANYIVADYMHGGGKVGLISYEMDTPYLLTLMVDQFANSTSPTEGYEDKCFKLMSERLLLINEMVDRPHSAIAKVHHMLQEGCKLIVLDCLQRINMPANDMTLERDFVVELTNLVRAHNAHLVLVHHSRKGSHADGDNPKPTIDDCKGHGGLADNAQNVCACWSNKKKKDRQFWLDQGFEGREEDEELLQEPDMLLMVKKQRLGAFEGTIGLWRTPARAFHTKGGRPFVYRPELENG